MGAGLPVMEESVDYLLKKREKVGVIAVHLYRQWSAKHFIAALPKTVKKIAVLDRTKEAGSFGLVVTSALRRRFSTGRSRSSASAPARPWLEGVHPGPGEGGL